VLASVTLASTGNELPEDGVFCAEKCRSYFNANFNIVFKTITCEFVVESKTLAILACLIFWHVTNMVEALDYILT
jgi:predicted nucleic acid-binding Zn ribbon protein